MFVRISTNIDHYDTMDQRSSTQIERGKDVALRDPRHAHRTLGMCAHCGKPVAVDGEYVRLYRRAWHTECALAADAHGARR